MQFMFFIQTNHYADDQSSSRLNYAKQIIIENIILESSARIPLRDLRMSQLITRVFKNEKLIDKEISIIQLETDFYSKIH